MSEEQYHSASHCKYLIQYHIIWCPKFRFSVLQGNVDIILKQILQKICNDYKYKIKALEVMPDHIHILVSIPPKYSVSQFMGYLKGKSSLMIFDRHANLKYKYGNRQFWCKGYYVDTVGRNKKVIAEYIRNQFAEDKISDQISIKEYFDPFTGEQVTKSK